MRHGPGLAASPPVRYILVAARNRDSVFCSTAVDGQALCQAVAPWAREDLLPASDTATQPGVPPQKHPQADPL